MFGMIHRRLAARPQALVGLLLIFGLAAVGCSRENFRIRADKDVEAVISQKNIFPNWQVENWHVYPDARSRYADSSSADYPAYPPDDYAAWLTSPNPQHAGRGGTGRYEGTGYLDSIAGWDAQNRADDPEPEQPATAAGNATELAAVTGGAAGFTRVFATTERPFRLKIDQAIELALLNSREFQDRREDLYLVALPVTLERYSFAAQAKAAEQIIRESTGRDVPGGGGEAWTIKTDPGFTRKFASGGELIVKLANQIVVDLSGPKPQTSISNLTLTFVQPLLGGGGLAVTLEALTLAERTLMYAVRSYARFRKVFYYAIVGSGGYTNNPYGLQGLSANLGRGVGANLTANSQGYLPTILRAATLANEQKNVAALEKNLRLFQFLKEGGLVTDLQVGQVEQSLINSRITLLNSAKTYFDNIDFFKLQLGVPTTLPLELDDAPLRPVRKQVQRFDALYAQLQDLEKLAGVYDPAEDPTLLRARWTKLLTESPLARGTPFATNYATTAGELQRETDDALVQRAKAFEDRRQKLLDARAERQLKKQPETEADQRMGEAIDTVLDRIRFEQALRRYETRPWLRVPPAQRVAEQTQAFRRVLDAGSLVAIQVRNQRLTEIRNTWPNLPALTVDGNDLLAAPLDEANTKIAQAALINRLDLMNARAQVVDSWRQITVRANALHGTFDVQYDLNTTTPRDEAAGLAFAGTRSRHTVTLRVEPPFVRRAERNQYRAALIGYQRSRRNLMAFEDNILADSRQDLRQVRQLAEAYGLQQRAVELSYAVLDNAQSTLVAPPDPAVRDTAASVAALTNQLLQAQSSLLRAQSDLYTIWVNYLTARMELYLDLELLPLDARGIWIDDTLTLPAAVERPGPVAPPPG